MNEYTEQGNKFLEETGTKMTVEFLYHGKHFDDDKDKRDVYKVTLERGGKSMEVKFGQSIAKSLTAAKLRAAQLEHRVHQMRRIPPTAYDVLACIEKRQPETDVWRFAQEFGYEINSRESMHRVEGICMAVIKEYTDVCRVFGGVLGKLQEIQ